MPFVLVSSFGLCLLCWYFPLGCAFCVGIFLWAVPFVLVSSFGLCLVCWYFPLGCAFCVSIFLCTVPFVLLVSSFGLCLCWYLPSNCVDVLGTSFGLCVKRLCFMLVALLQMFVLEYFCGLCTSCLYIISDCVL